MLGVECAPALDEPGLGIDEQCVEPEIDGEVRTAARENAIARTDVDEEARSVT